MLMLLNKKISSGLMCVHFIVCLQVLGSLWILTNRAVPPVAMRVQCCWHTRDTLRRSFNHLCGLTLHGQSHKQGNISFFFFLNINHDWCPLVEELNIKIKIYINWIYFPQITAWHRLTLSDFKGPIFYLLLDLYLSSWAPGEQPHRINESLSKLTENISKMLPIK